MPAKKSKRKKPKRKRQIVRATQPNDIPYSKYRIEWTDIISDSGWADEDKFDKMTLVSHFAQLNIVGKFLILYHYLCTV